MPSPKATTLTRKVLAEVKRAEGITKSRAKNHCPIKVLLRGILKSDMHERSALIALNRLEKHFADWNEVRVSSPFEIAAAMDAGGNDFAHAEWIQRLLTCIFDATNEMSLRALLNLTPTQATRIVARVINVPKPQTQPATDTQETARVVKNQTTTKKIATAAKPTAGRKKRAAPAKRAAGKSKSGAGRGTKKRSKK